MDKVKEAVELLKHVVVVEDRMLTEDHLDRLYWMQIHVLKCSYHVVRTALQNAGYARRVARRKPPISERVRNLRLQWAIEHVNWTQEDWQKILWSDETWVNGDRHTKTYVTRRPGEEWDPTCIVERFQRRKGWMF